MIRHPLFYREGDSRRGTPTLDIGITHEDGRFVSPTGSLASSTDSPKSSNLDLQDQIESLELTVKEKTAEIITLKAQLDTLTKLNTSLTDRYLQKVNEHETQASSLQRHLRDLQSQLDQKQKKLVEAQKLVEDFKKEKVICLAKIEKLEQILDTGRARFDALKQKYESTKAELVNVSLQSTDQRAELEELQLGIDRQLQEIEILKTLVREQASQIAILQAPPGYGALFGRSVDQSTQTETSNEPRTERSSSSRLFNIFRTQRTHPEA
jgi:chromosome segregation ATPase